VIDIGRVGEHAFLEAAGVGVVAGLFGYFNKLDNSAWGSPARAREERRDREREAEAQIFPLRDPLYSDVHPAEPSF
jgi:hypothetical protein